MSWFKDKKEDEEYEDDFNYDPTNPYTSEVEDDFIEVNIKDLINADKSNNESKLPTEQ
jgi:hypothetical protein